MMEPWFLNPELLAEIEISKNEKGAYRVRSHPLDAPKHAKSEEIIRQIVLAQLRCHYHYPQELLSQEHIIQMGEILGDAACYVANYGNSKITVRPGKVA